MIITSEKNTTSGEISVSHKNFGDYAIVDGEGGGYGAIVDGGGRRGR